VLIELDCKLVVDSIFYRNSNQAEFGSIISECRSLLKHYSNFKISFVMRQANFVAHTLARASRLNARYQEFDLIPSCIETIARNEIMSFCSSKKSVVRQTLLYVSVFLRVFIIKETLIVFVP